MVNGPNIFQMLLVFYMYTRAPSVELPLLAGLLWRFQSKVENFYLRIFDAVSPSEHRSRDEGLAPPLLPRVESLHNS